MKIKAWFASTFQSLDDARRRKALYQEYEALGKAITERLIPAVRMAGGSMEGTMRSFADLGCAIKASGMPLTV